MSNFPTYSTYEAPSIYDRIPHKRMEFWHKNVHIFGLEIESAKIEIRKDDTLYSFGNTKNIKNIYSFDGGTCKIKVAKSVENRDIFAIIKNNLDSARRNFICIDGVLRNKNTNNYLQLNMLGVAYESQESYHDVLCISFLAIKSQ
jgi:hypothetical protein